METIYAVSTPPAAGGIAVIRLSGENAIPIAESVFKGKKPTLMEGYTCAHGYIYDTDIIDEVILTVYRAPHSYTGEDVVEISCHGGIYVTEQILSLLCRRGASPAGPGEFTKRSFLNGKMDLTRAEAVMEMIGARGAEHLRRARRVMEGRLYAQSSACADSIRSMCADIAAWNDYPDEDIPFVDPEKLKAQILSVTEQIEGILSGASDSSIVRNGIDTVIAGKPNVGKSTLMNLLAGNERSIVTDIAGTTRDVIEESVRVGAAVLRLSDTAGLHETSDRVEGMGIERAVSRIRTADLILAVFDSTSAPDDEDMRLIQLCRECTGECIAIINKTDTGDSKKLYDLISPRFPHTVEISAVTGEGTETLKALIESMVKGSDSGNELIINERQKKCLEDALSLLKESYAAVDDITLDAVGILLDDALSSLMTLSGQNASESVVDEVFSRFCVGK